MKLGALLSLGFDRYIKGILRFFDGGEVTPAKVVVCFVDAQSRVIVRPASSAVSAYRGRGIRTRQASYIAVTIRVRDGDIHRLNRDTARTRVGSAAVDTDSSTHHCIGRFDACDIPDACCASIKLGELDMRSCVILDVTA